MRTNISFALIGVDVLVKIGYGVGCLGGLRLNSWLRAWLGLRELSLDLELDWSWLSCFFIVA